MPATEQTWRNLKKLHVIFGVSAVALLLTTIWMLAADHNREAKSMQKQFAEIEAQTIAWRKSEQTTADYAETEQRLKDALEVVRSTVPADAPAAVDGFVKEANEKAAANGYDVDSVRSTGDAWVQGANDKDAKPDQKIARREALISAMQRVIDKALFVENESQRKLKFEKAELDVDVSSLAIEIDEGRPPQKIDATQAKVTKTREEVENDLTVAYQENKRHRLALQGFLATIKAPEVAAQKEIDKHEADVKRLQTAYEEKRPNAGKSLLEMPILDAFGGPLKPQQVWLPELTWNNNFRNVARFDRCITCHQGIDKSAPGSAVNPAYDATRSFTVALDTPKTEPTVDQVYTQEKDAQGETKLVPKSLNERLVTFYGMKLSESGLLDPDDVTVEAVYTGNSAVKADLKAGDVIEKVNGAPLLTLADADDRLAKNVVWGKPLQLTVRRGLPHPYSSHPRLDLFVGSMSPHKIGDFGCTICHEGQGNATAFKWVSHTPNDPDEADAWRRKWGWFNNHHWIYPMLPERFQEANCVKCHHDVTELKPSERFPDPPAPKLIEGFTTIEDVGCFGCHEINGYDGPSKRRGPDLRAEPNWFAAAAQVLADPKLQGKSVPPELARLVELAKQSVDHPEVPQTRKLLAELIQADAAPKADGKPQPVLSPATHAMAGMLAADDETPGRYPKVGPSLRYVASKNDLPFLYSWIKNPRSYRPSTKMPTFFGLHDHLRPPKHDEHGHVELGKDGKPVLDEQTKGLKDAQRFEPLEILAASKYLLAESQPFEQIAPAKTAADGKAVLPADAERGKVAFQTRGCLACHSHADFPGIDQRQGPDLTGLGAKLTSPVGKDWLYTWLKQPHKYHARTVMPNLLLDPQTITTNTAEGAKTTTTDPAADIAAFLLSGTEIRVDADTIGRPAAAEGPSAGAPSAPGTGTKTQPWKPEALPTVDAGDLDELLKLYLAGAFTKSESDKFVKEGIPSARRTQLKGDEQLLVTDAGTLTEEQKLLYLGKKTIGRLGCAGCHDVPGFEDSKPIGTGLADWGRKESSKLAFEQIARYLHDRDAHHGETVGAPDKDKGFFMEAMAHHQREGFLWQKLREPRSYDYMKTENKSYIDRLRMPKFNLSDAQRESIMTFVLGLVAEPPPAKYVYKPSPRREAELAGQRVIDKYNCAGCHAMKMQEWAVTYQPGKMQAASTEGEYDYLVPHFTPQQIAESKKTDRRGLGHATIHGLPLPKEDEEEPTVYFKLWSNELIDGQTWLSGGADVEIDERLNPPGKSVRRPQQGGVFANYAHPVVLAAEKKANPSVKATDVWGFVPPPLVGQGRKTQPQWFHDFLLEPFPIRPSVVLRMPKFHLTSNEARLIVNHFAARDNAEYPYEYDPRSDQAYLATRDSAYRENKTAAQKAAPAPGAAPPAGGAPAGAAPGAPGAAPLPSVPPGKGGRLEDALALVTDNQFCVKCHRIGDYTPPGALSAQAPNLANIHNRLRPEYLRNWIANPVRILPYTGMPVNFPKTQSVGQHKFKGTSAEQVEAIVDLLMNYDDYMKSQKSLASMVQVAPAPGAPATPGAAPAAAPPAAAPAGGAPANPATPPATSATPSNSGGGE
jgi:cytochrome c2